MKFFQLALTESNLIQLFKDGDYDAIISIILAKAPSVIAAVVIVIIGYIISKFIGKLVVKAMSAKGVDPSIHSFIKTVIMLLLNFIFILSALLVYNYSKINVPKWSGLWKLGFSMRIGCQER